MEKSTNILFTLLVISTITQTYSAPPIKISKLPRVPTVDNLKIKFTEETLPKNFLEEAVNDLKGQLVPSNFKTVNKPPEDLPSELRNFPSEISGIVRKESHDDNKAKTDKESGGFLFSATSMLRPEKKTQLSSGSDAKKSLEDTESSLFKEASMSRETGNIDMIAKEPEVHSPKTEKLFEKELDDTHVEDSYKISDGFHFSAYPRSIPSQTGLSRSHAENCLFCSDVGNIIFSKPHILKDASGKILNEEFLAKSIEDANWAAKYYKSVSRDDGNVRITYRIEENPNHGPIQNNDDGTASNMRIKAVETEDDPLLARGQLTNKYKKKWKTFKKWLSEGMKNKASRIDDDSTLSSYHFQDISNSQEKFRYRAAMNSNLGK